MKSFISLLLLIVAFSFSTGIQATTPDLGQSSEMSFVPDVDVGTMDMQVVQDFQEVEVDFAYVHVIRQEHEAYKSIIFTNSAIRTIDLIKRKPMLENPFIIDNYFIKVLKQTYRRPRDGVRC